MLGKVESIEEVSSLQQDFLFAGGNYFLVELCMSLPA